MSETSAVQRQYDKMTKTKVSKLILTLAVPTIISMLTTSIYSMADTYFVSQLGTSAAGAVGIVFSLMAAIQAAGFLLGMGAGSLISRYLGQKERELANKTGSIAFFLALFLGTLVAALGLFFLDPLMLLLGSTDTILPYARDYAQYILLGAPVMCSSFVLNNLLRSQGRATLSMIGIAAGGILNIGLDPVFIYGLNMGIAGAAIATLISQCISFVILLSFFLTGKSTVRLSIRCFSLNPGIIFTIVKTGLPSMLRQGLASVATVMLNSAAKEYGDPAVAAVSIVARIFMLVLSVMLGFGQGYMPVVGFNYGAKRFDRVREALRFAMITGTVILTVLAVGGFLFAEDIITIFRRDDLQVIGIGTVTLRAQCIMLPLQAMIVLSNMTYQVIGRAWQATFISSCRQGVFFIPLILILPGLFGLFGLQITQAAADLCTFVCAVPFMVKYLKDLHVMEQREKAASNQESPQETPSLE